MSIAGTLASTLRPWRGGVRWGAVQSCWRPPDQYNGKWTERSAWDFQPLNSVVVNWRRGKDSQQPRVVHLLLEHVADTCLERALISKNLGALNDPLGELTRTEVGDPPAAVWRARWVANLSKTERISEQIWKKEWSEIYLLMYSGDFVAHFLAPTSSAVRR
jgi:hypothetical protein